VFANLLNNAAKYTERGGHIGVRVARDGEHAVVEIRDDAAGIARERLVNHFGGDVDADRVEAQLAKPARRAPRPAAEIQGLFPGYVPGE
jgi:K+-sensing histidine kinase KdpD